jgi:hypothetical protein
LRAASKRSRQNITLIVRAARADLHQNVSLFDPARANFSPTLIAVGAITGFTTSLLANKDPDDVYLAAAVGLVIGGFAGTFYPLTAAATPFIGVAYIYKHHVIKIAD